MDIKNYRKLRFCWRLNLRLTAVCINGEICGKFTFIFRKKFYLSRKITVTKFATSASRETLCAIARHVNWKIVIKFLRNKDEVKSGKIASIFGQALQRKFAENIFSKRRRLKGLPKLYKKNDKVKYFFNVTDLTSVFKTNFITKIL